MPLGVLVHEVGEVTAARYLVEGRKAEVEQDCSSFATLRDGRTLLPGRQLRPGGSAPVFEVSHLYPSDQAVTGSFDWHPTAAPR
ncbi:hypothetical protein GCM10010505_64930 [Kitasatospora aburaviensis]